MKNPIGDVLKVEDNQQNAGTLKPNQEDKSPGSKSMVKKQGNDNRFKGPIATFKINPKNFDWFMAGID